MTAQHSFFSSTANLSILKNEKGKAIRFSTLDALCKALDPQPGDLLEYVEDESISKNSGTDYSVFAVFYELLNSIVRLIIFLNYTTARGRT